MSIDQNIALRLQLAMIADNEPSSSFLEIRWKRLTRGMDQTFVPVGEANRVIRVIRNRAQLSDTYIGVCPRIRRSGTAEDVERAWCLWVDVDTPEALARLRAFRPLPSIAIRTGNVGNLHAYWPLSSSFPASWVKPACRRLVRHLGADRQAAEPARILRLLSVGRAVTAGVSPACSFADASVTGPGGWR